MCGLAGWIDLLARSSNEELNRGAERMIGPLLHRGPDSSGIWTDQRFGIAFGHRRLAIIDLSAEGHQPMHSRSGRFAFILNGEIYNFQDIREELLALGHSFRGHSDTEVLLAGFEQWGVKASIERAVGMFALAVWDRETAKLILARDRAGEKPLYFGKLGDRFYFGSELKALEGHPDFRAEVSWPALSSYLRHGYVPGPLSIFEGVSKLQPGHLATLSYAEGKGWSAPEIQPYWALQPGVDPRYESASDEEVVDETESALLRSVRGQMISDVPLGAFLSGGIDSSLIAALMQKQSGTPVQTFSIGFWEEQYNEAEQAKAVARHLGTSHEEWYVTPEDAMGVIPLLPQMYDEPFADSSQIPTHLVSKLARKKVTVSLSGDAGDELFGGYNRYAWVPSIWSKISKVPRPLRGAAASAALALSPDAWNRIYGSVPKSVLPGKLQMRLPGDKLHKLADVFGCRSPAEMHHRLMSIVKAPSELLARPVDDQAWAHPYGGDESLGFETRMMAYDFHTYLPEDILAKVDRAAMAVSLETRVPFLDHRVAELAFSLPDRFKIRNGKTKWVLREILARHVPKSLYQRPKMGFQLPLDRWLRGPLRPWAEELLSPARLKNEGFFQADAVQRKWQEHLSGRRNLQGELWTILMFQAWQGRNRPGVS